MGGTTSACSLEPSSQAEKMRGEKRALVSNREVARAPRRFFPESDEYPQGGDRREESLLDTTFLKAEKPNNRGTDFLKPLNP